MLDRQRDFGVGEDAKPLLYPGELRGYRYWRLADDGTLRPITKSRRHIRWDAELAAWCPFTGKAFVEFGAFLLPVDELKKNVLGRSLVTTAAAERKFTHGAVPYRRCSCGIYAWHSAGDAALNHVNGRLSLTGNSRQIFGVIAASGTVIPGSKGFRAERARIEALCLPEQRWPVHRVMNAAAQEKCKRRHNGVAFFTDVGSLVKAFPPQGNPWWDPTKARDEAAMEDEIEEGAA